MSIFDKQVITLNIESDSARLLCIKNGEIEQFGEVEIPRGMIVSGLIYDPEGIAQVVSSLFRSLKVSKRNVLVAVNGFRSIVRYVTLPKLGQGKTSEAVMWAAEREMPVSLDTLAVWWRVMETTASEQKVFMIGVPRDILFSLKDTLEHAGITVRAMDSKPFTLCRLAEYDDAIVTNLEKNSISVIVKSNGIPVIIQSLLLTAENSEIEDIVKRLSDDLFRTIEYFNQQHKDQTIDQKASVYVTGGLVTDKINDMVRRDLGRTTLIPDVLQNTPPDFPRSKYAVNFGLYLREANIKHLNPNRQNKKIYVKPDIRNASIYND